MGKGQWTMDNGHRLAILSVLFILCRLLSGLEKVFCLFNLVAKREQVYCLLSFVYWSFVYYIL
jgi:hypothetical protein